MQKDQPAGFRHGGPGVHLSRPPAFGLDELNPVGLLRVEFIYYVAGAIGTTTIYDYDICVLPFPKLA